MKFKIGDVLEFTKPFNGYFEKGRHYMVADIFAESYYMKPVPNNLPEGTLIKLHSSAEYGFVKVEEQL